MLILTCAIALRATNPHSFFDQFSIFPIDRYREEEVGWGDCWRLWGMYQLLLSFESATNLERKVNHKNLGIC